MANFLYGAIAMAGAVVALSFFRFYRRTGDRFFLYFCASFAIESMTRFVSVFLQWSEQDNSWFYVFRVVAYGLILMAIVDKNIRRAPTR